MKNYFFFKTKREMNEQNEYRIVLYALPGQLTYRIHHGFVRVETTLKVQPDNQSRHILRNYPMGTVFGICIEGNTPHAASLKVYSRNDTQFYRAENLVPEPLFDEDMRGAYEIFCTENAQPDEASQPQTDTAGRGYEPRDLDVVTLNRHRTLLKGFHRHFEETAEPTGLTPAGGGNKICRCLSKMLEQMACGIISFQYRKVNGEHRPARGTRNPDIINQHLGREARGTGVRLDTDIDRSIAHFDYFDVDKREWRKFCIENLCIQ